MSANYEGVFLREQLNVCPFYHWFMSAVLQTLDIYSLILH